MDGSGWAAGLRKMETSTKAATGRMAGSFASAIGGVFAVGFLRQATMRMVAHADAIDKMAKRMESTTDTAQRFDFAASQNGATIGEIEKAFMRTAASMEGAKQGLTTQMRAFQAFGITLQQIKTSTPEEIFLKIAEAIEKAGGALDKAKSLQDIMGRGGRQLVPAFVSGFAATAADAPEPIDAETITNLADFNDQLDRLKREALPFAAKAVGLLADVIEQAIPKNDIELPIHKKAIVATTFALSEEIRSKLDSDTMAQRRMGIDIPQSEWNRLSDAHGKALERVAADWMSGSNPFLRGPAGVSQKGSNWIKDAIGGTSTADEAAAAAAKAWAKPSLQLNSLQRIGAAVTQSADPIAIEKNNNKLLQNIARNTKKIADAEEQF